MISRGRGDFESEQFIDVGRSDQRQIQGKAEHRSDAEFPAVGGRSVNGKAFGNLAFFAKDFPGILFRGLDDRRVIGYDENAIGASNTLYGPESVRQHGACKIEALLGSKDRGETLLGVAEIFYREENGAHGEELIRSFDVGQVARGRSQTKFSGRRSRVGSAGAENLTQLVGGAALRGDATDGTNPAAKFFRRSTYSPKFAPAALEMLSSMRVPPKSSAPALRQARERSRPSLTQET